MDVFVQRSPARLIAGIVLVALGILFTLDTLGLASVPDLGRLWPLILVAIGLSQIRGRLFRGSMVGHILLGLGVLFLLYEYGVIRHPLRFFWPALLVFIGMRIVLSSRPHTAVRREDGSVAADPSATLANFAVFSGVNRKIASQEFRGGELAAFCGGWDVDLRQADIAGSEAVIDIFCWWGGGEIRVPAHWEVVVQVFPLFGGISDRTMHTAPQPGIVPKRLVLTGTAVMGGVEIKN